MKQRFSSLDVKVIAHELQESLVSLRLANVYDLSSKILLLKFAKPNNKKQLLIDSGFRCHLTDFARTTAAAPSAFVARLRKFLKTRRLTSVRQIGTDRIIEFRFSDGQYRLFLEFFASGNVILTDADLKILALLRNVPEGEGQEPQRVGLSYSLENRQNYGGAPPLTEERLRDALRLTVDRAARKAAAASGKKSRSRPGDELRKGLATTITELPPMLVDHSFLVTNFDPSISPAEILENDELLAHLLRALTEARRVVEEATTSEKATGYIIAKHKNGKAEPGETPGDSADTEMARREDLLYEDFHPFQPQKAADDPSAKVLTFEGFNKTVDEYFSSLEGQKLESKLSDREAAAKRKLEATKEDHAKRLEGLQEAQTLNEQKAAAIEANLERVQEAMDAVNGLLQQGMDWVNINKLIEREQERGNPVAEMIKLPLRLHEDVITLLLGREEEMDDDDMDEAYESGYESGSESGSESSDDEDAGAGSRGADKRLQVDVHLSLSPWANARGYYEQRRTAAVKQQKTLQQSGVALKNAERKIEEDLKKGLKQEKAVLQPIRRQMWFEKFIWFISSDGYLVLGGKDAHQNEMLYKRYLRKGDVYCHADLHGATSVIVKNNPKTPDAPIPPATLAQAGMVAVCSSSAWDSKAGMGAWWVHADQVSKSAPSGEYLPVGSFTVRGQKNFLPPAPLLLGLGVLFRISEESKARHVKHRLRDDADSVASSAPQESIPETTIPSAASTSAQEAGDDESMDEQWSGDEEEEEEEDSAPRDNPLQGRNNDDEGDEAGEGEPSEDPAPVQEMGRLEVSGKPSEPNKPDVEEEESVKKELAERVGDGDGADDGDDSDAVEDGDGATERTATEGQTMTDEGPSAPASSRGGSSTPANTKKPQKRGQKRKAKKMATRYKDQDEEDRLAAQALIGASKGRQRAEAEAKAKAQREAELAAQKERRRAQHERRKKETAEHEEVRRLMREEGVEVLEADEEEKTTALDDLVGTPLPGDELVEAIPVCAPWNAMARCKYRVKMQPGALKKGKAVKEILERWKADSGRKGALDERAQDTERMWPREVELIKGFKAEEVINVVPVGKVRVMMAGGSGGGGGGGGGGKGGQGKGGRGGKGSKRK
ncbi:hypothetical protein SODALDRAFT_346319 [Sodiomyces alkalinus F11]|uniref:Ribosome quality control complex subunit 2 n=1 Tax=Sodiomyces alkalinus (strain CBS 110278 / VKM F-3762 / F11) TaxID=1314773 RepID=A0A3N2PLG6_SODAK|nr:hypothetical protein SODALDRAFT_346319 [Sodiomyces alkalinus F11]ROT35367.1 hypothetical protein SODALDRAFT_346319 [Sodiomyces alkalinus F11]